jgi:lysine 2,3-aminomutase
MDQIVGNVAEEEPPSQLAVSISPHLMKLAKNSVAIRKQFYPNKLEKIHSELSLIDPLLEDQFVKVRGLIHKYPGRVLITLTMSCAAYCRFCTRRRMVSDIEKGLLCDNDLTVMVEYLKAHPEVYEVIFSGGDPVTARILLIKALKKISALKSIKVIRIHTRVPVSSPDLFKDDLIETIAAIKKQPVYISIHFEHPDELSAPTIKLVKKLRSAGAILMSQSVFLKGVNDNVEVLKTLFTRLSELGIRPYYIYRCDPVVGAEHFIVPFDREVEIMTKLRSKISGIACPTYVIDTPNGAGKIPVPLNYWEYKKSQFIDFWGKKIKVYR